MKKNYKEKENIIDETLRLLAQKYPIGLYEYLFKYEPEMYKKLRFLEDKISKNYKNKSVEEIKVILIRFNYLIYPMNLFL